jgi:hypothetical protein
MDDTPSPAHFAFLTTPRTLFMRLPFRPSPPEPGKGSKSRSGGDPGGGGNSLLWLLESSIYTNASGLSGGVVASFCPLVRAPEKRPRKECCDRCVGLVAEIGMPPAAASSMPGEGSGMSAIGTFGASRILRMRCMMDLDLLGPSDRVALAGGDPSGDSMSLCASGIKTGWGGGMTERLFVACLEVICRPSSEYWSRWESRRSRLSLRLLFAAARELPWPSLPA